MGVTFNNPFGLSAGLDKNCDMPVLLDHIGFGFETVGSTTARVCEGNAHPWFHRLPEYDALTVHVGLANDGSATVIPRAQQAWRNARNMQVSISLAQTNDSRNANIDEAIEDYRVSLERAANRTSIIEVNISCPNVRIGEPFLEPDTVDKLFHVLDQIDHQQPIIVKMPHSTRWEQMRDLLDALADHDVQGVTISNLRKDRTGLTIPQDYKGGISGSPTYHSSNELVRKAYQHYGERFAIAGVGGVFTAKQAYEKIRNGASLVMFVTSLMYRGPQQITTLKRGLARLLRADGFTSVSQAVGVNA